MKYSVNPVSISSFVVGGTGSEYGLPMAVISTWDLKRIWGHFNRGDAIGKKTGQAPSGRNNRSNRFTTEVI